MFFSSFHYELFVPSMTQLTVSFSSHPPIHPSIPRPSYDFLVRGVRVFPSAAAFPPFFSVFDMKMFSSFYVYFLRRPLSENDVEPSPPPSFIPTSFIHPHHPPSSPPPSSDPPFSFLGPTRFLEAQRMNVFKYGRPEPFEPLTGLFLSPSSHGWS